MNMIVGKRNRDLEHNTEMQGFRLEIKEKEMRAKQCQYEARMMAAATRSFEEVANGIQKQSKEE